jgi:ribosomal-protein-alanine N-acetyltransferase
VEMAGSHTGQHTGPMPHPPPPPPSPLHATLHTPRLVLLPAGEGLAARVTAFYQRNAAHLAPWDPPTPEGFATEAFQRERLQRAVADAGAGTAMRWWLEPRDDPSRLVGSIGLTQIARGVFQNAMLGYAIDVACQGQGLMREALQAVIDHAFSQAMQLHRIQANVRPENIRSTALLHRLGFDDEGLAREYLYIDGAWRDHRMYALRHAGFVGVPC